MKKELAVLLSLGIVTTVIEGIEIIKLKRQHKKDCKEINDELDTISEMTELTNNKVKALEVETFNQLSKVKESIGIK